jgi:hypothetical protein
MRRLRLLVVLAGLAVVVAAGAFVLWQRPERVTKENYDRMQLGMTHIEVEAILGPPGDYRSGLGEAGWYKEWIPDPDPIYSPPSWNRVSTPTDAPENGGLWARWLSDSFQILIVVDESGQVMHKEGYPRRRTQGQVDALVWRAKRQWRRWFPE